MLLGLVVGCRATMPAVKAHWALTVAGLSRMQEVKAHWALLAPSALKNQMGRKQSPSCVWASMTNRRFLTGAMPRAQVLPNSVGDTDDVGQAGDVPGDWVREHDGDEGPGDVVADMPDDAGRAPGGGGDWEQVLCRLPPVRVAGALPVHGSAHREGIAGDGDGVERVREDDLDSGCWDTDTGEQE